MKDWWVYGKDILGYRNEQVDEVINNLSVEYFCSVSIYVYYVTGLESTVENIRYTKMMIELFSLEEFNELICNTNFDSDLKMYLKKSTFYQEPNHILFKDVRKTVLERLDKKKSLLLKQLAI